MHTDSQVHVIKINIAVVKIPKVNLNLELYYQDSNLSSRLTGWLNELPFRSI